MIHIDTSASPGFSKHEFTCIVLYKSMSYLKYEQFLCMFCLFRHDNTKNGRQKVLTSIITSLLRRA